MSNLDQTVQQLIDEHYHEGGARVFFLGVKFIVSEEELGNIDVGDAPSNYKDEAKIAAWKATERAKVANRPEIAVGIGSPDEVLVATYKGDVVTRDPQTAVAFIGEVLDRGAAVFGLEAPQRLRALAIWSMLVGGPPVDLLTLRRPGPVMLSCLVMDPVDFFLSSKATSGDRARFCSGVNLFLYDRVHSLEWQIEDMVLLFSPSRTDVLSTLMQAADLGVHV